MMRFTAWLRRRSSTTGPRSGERGQTNTEYALIVAAVAVLLIAAVWALGGSAGDRISTTAGAPGGPLPPRTVQCDPSYPGACIPPPPPKLNCSDLRARGIPLPVKVVGRDPHGLDPDGDGLGC
jgi:Flp pilus assembly pilin Flp